jgi:hypothetical protein
MIMLILAVLLGLCEPAAAQSTLQLPDVTLLGEYTLFLSVPSPPAQEVPQATGVSDSRFNYPRYLFKVDLAVPRPPQIYWQRIPPSTLAPPGLLPDLPLGEADRFGGDGQTQDYGGWQAGIDYIPAKTVVSEFSAVRSSGHWDLAARLNFDLADGWITSPPALPTDLTFTAQSRRRAETIDFDAALGVGAFYSADPGSADPAAVYTLGLDAGTRGEAGVFQWQEETRLFGISGIGNPPVDPDRQRTAVQQNLELSLIGSRWELELRSAGVLAAGFPGSGAEEHGRSSLELGWRHPDSILRLWAGGAALYYDDSLDFYPSGGLELYPTESFSFSIRAAPFLGLPPQELQNLSAAQTVSQGSTVPHLRCAGGYSLRSEISVDPAAPFAASLSFEWMKGRIYLLDASERELTEPELRFAASNRGALQGDLIWQMRAAHPGVRVHLTGAFAAAFPVSASMWQDRLYSHAGLVWSTDFYKLPVEFIIKALIGDYADDGSEPFLFSNWEIVSGIVTSIEGNWKIGEKGVVHTGLEAFLSPNMSFRFLIGYGFSR